MIAASLSHFSTLVILMVGVFTIVGMLWKTVKTAIGVVYAQVEATKENTKAIHELSERMERVEQAVV
jgi:hypothetical protein